MTTNSLSQEILVDFMRQRLRMDTADLNEETALFTSYRLDSLGMVELITFVEATAGIRVQPQDVTLDNFDTIKRILNFVHAASGRG